MNFASRERTAERAAPDWAYSLALVVVALVPRLFVAIAWAKEPVWDGHYYHFGAVRIAEGFGYSEDVIINGVEVWKPWVHYPVGYSGLLAALYFVFGSGLLVAPLANALIGTLLVLVAHRVARHYLSQTRARVAGAIIALHPGLIAYSALVMNEPLSGLLVLGALWAVLARQSRWDGIIGAGVLLGVATLVRPSTLLAAPLLVLALPKPWLGRCLKMAAALGVALVCVLPWTIRNCRVMDGCALVSTNGGWNLAIGALTETGRFRTLRASDGCPVVTGQVQQDRCWAEVGAKKIREDVGHWLSLMPEKLAHTYDHESFAVEYLHEADPGTWPEKRRAAGRHLMTWMHRLLLIFAALSVVAVPRFRGGGSTASWTQGALLFAVTGLASYAVVSEAHAFWPLALAIPLIAVLRLPGAPYQGPAGRYLIGIVAATSLTHAVFFGDDRYHIVVSPILCLLAAAALRAPSPHGGAHAAGSTLPATG